MIHVRYEWAMSYMNESSLVAWVRRGCARFQITHLLRLKENSFPFERELISAYNALQGGEDS